MPTTPSITLYGIPNCDTVKKARAWLTEHQVSYAFHDFKKQGLSPDTLDRWLAQIGWETLLNRQGTTWRKLDKAVQQSVIDNASAGTLILQNLSLIKRPVVQWSQAHTTSNDINDITVGFLATEWAKRLG